jgi:hypothetical protein
MQSWDSSVRNDHNCMNDPNRERASSCGSAVGGGGGLPKKRKLIEGLVADFRRQGAASLDSRALSLPNAGSHPQPLPPTLTSVSERPRTTG